MLGFFFTFIHQKKSTKISSSHKLANRKVLLWYDLCSPLTNSLVGGGGGVGGYIYSWLDVKYQESILFPLCFIYIVSNTSSNPSNTFISNTVEFACSATVSFTRAPAEVLFTEAQKETLLHTHQLLIFRQLDAGMLAEGKAHKTDRCQQLTSSTSRSVSCPFHSASTQASNWQKDK